MKVYPNMEQALAIFTSSVYPQKKMDCHMDTGMDCLGLPQVCSKMDSNVVNSAMDIVHRKSGVSERHLIDRLDNIEKQVKALQDSLKGWFSQGNNE
jgi:hypothetical protein